MDISSLLPSSDNIYKFLFMGGIFMLVFSFLYPLEKKQKLELEVVKLKEEVAIQDFEIKKIQVRIDSLKSEVKPNIKKLEEAKKINNPKITKEIQQKFNESYSYLQEREKDLNIKNIKIGFENDKILLLTSHINEFNIFQYIFLIVGPLFIVIGLGGWFNSVNTSDKIQKIQLKKLERDTNIIIPSNDLINKILKYIKTLFH